MNQQLGFAIKLLELVSGSSAFDTEGVTTCVAAPNRFTRYALIHSAILQWDLAVRYWLDEVVNSSSCSTEFKRVFADVKPVHTLPLSHSLARVVQLLTNSEHSELFLERLIESRNSENGWLFILENAFASFELSETEWDERYNHDAQSHDANSSVILIASSSVSERLHRKYWRTIEACQLLALIDDCKLFIDDVRSLSAEN